MLDKTPYLDLTLMAIDQAAKHITHNEAIMALDRLVHLTVSAEIDAPPSDPEMGQRFIVGPDSQGAWLGHSGDLVI